MSSVAQRLLTAEEFVRLPGSKHQELVRGKVVDTYPAGGRHGEVTAALVALLHTWAKRGSGGYVAVEAGYILGHDPDIVLGPDISYVSLDRIPLEGIPDAFWTIAPDLAVEVISPTDMENDIREKIRDYLAAGTRLVWTVHPRTRDVVVYTGDGLARTYGENDVIEYPEVLPGFSCKVSELFV